SSAASAAAIRAKLSATLAIGCTPPTIAMTCGVFMCSSQTARSPGCSRRITSRCVSATIAASGSAIQQPRRERRVVRQHTCAAGSLERRQSLEDEGLALARAGRRGSLDHRVLTADLVGEDRHLEPLLHPANDVEIGQTRLDDHAVGALGEIELDLAQRLLGVARVHLV